MEFGASEQVLDPAVVQQGSKQRAVPNGLEVLEHVDVADIEEIDESDGFDLQQERKTQQKVHAVHSDLLLDVEHAMHAVDGAEDSLGSRGEELVLRTLRCRGGGLKSIQWEAGDKELRSLWARVERGERGNDVGRIGERGVWVDREEKKARGGIDPNVTTVFLT